MTYLGFEILGGQRELGTEHKEVICRTPEPQTVKELQTFLGMTGWCHLWIYNYGLMVKPLCDLIKINQSKLVWTGEAQKVFKQLKQELMILKYQAILVEQDDVEIVITNIVNPASFLSDAPAEPVIHDCLETIETVYYSRPDLKEESMEDAEETWFTDGSSFVTQRQRKAGYAITTTQQVIESKPLPPGTSAQKAEIVALTRALELAAGKRVNIWTIYIRRGTCSWSNLERTWIADRSVKTHEVC